MQSNPLSRYHFLHLSAGWAAGIGAHAASNPATRPGGEGAPSASFCAGSCDPILASSAKMGAGSHDIVAYLRYYQFEPSRVHLPRRARLGS